MKVKHLIIGAGPSGLATAYELVKHGERDIVVLDKNEQVGGLARTELKDGYKFDVGPHRFFTKNQEIQDLWVELLGQKFIQVDRLTRIHYNGRLFKYPIEINDLLSKLSVLELSQIAASYLYASVAYRKMEPQTFEEWITKNFGTKLFNMFFKTYTEKVWGIPCNEIGAEWASQRIKNLNFTAALKNAVGGKNKGKTKVKSLVDRFWYPEQGAGQMYEEITKRITAKGAKVKLHEKVVSIEHSKHQVDRVITESKGKKQVYEVTGYVYSSMPLTHFIENMCPLPPKSIIKANKKLYYRDHITVNLVVNQPNLFDDNWIYVHSPEVKMARIANYNNFSKKMLASKKNSAIGVEYFVFQKDDLWKMSDADLVKLAWSELEQIDLLRSSDQLITSLVTRETESYPTYYQGHKPHFDVLKQHVDGLTNAIFIGRGGQYKYNNQDHAMMTGLLAARKVLGQTHLDPWAVNEDAEYHEEKKE